MARALVLMMALALCAGAPAWAQEGGASGVPLQPPDQVEVLPEKKPQVEPRGMAAMLADYPSIALRRREQGDVRLSMCVNEQGRARDVRLVQSSGSKALDDASLQSAQKIRFHPARNAEGEPVDWCDPPYVMTIAWRLPPR